MNVWDSIFLNKSNLKKNSNIPKYHALQDNKYSPFVYNLTLYTKTLALKQLSKK